jgi:hypothetical protein
VPEDGEPAVEIELEHVDGLRVLQNVYQNLVSFAGATIGTEPDEMGRFVETRICSVTVAPALPGMQRPGDSKQNGVLDMSDIFATLGHIVRGLPERLPSADGSLAHPSKVTLLDSSGDGVVDISDVIHDLGYLFLGWDPPELGVECVRVSACPDLCE